MTYMIVRQRRKYSYCTQPLFTYSGRRSTGMELQNEENTAGEEMMSLAIVHECTNYGYPMYCLSGRLKLSEFSPAEMDMRDNNAVQRNLTNVCSKRYQLPITHQRCIVISGFGDDSIPYAGNPVLWEQNPTSQIQASMSISCVFVCFHSTVANQQRQI